jgi:hypothetical protein
MVRLLKHPAAFTILALMICSVPAAAQTEVPFAGTMTSDTTDVIVGDCFDYTEYTVAGSCMPLGHFTGFGSQRVSYCGPPDIEGDVTVFAGNGDQLAIHYIGTRMDLFSYTCDLSATGGTGRFAGAMVSGTLQIPAYNLDHPFDGTFEGTIVFP